MDICDIINLILIRNFYDQNNTFETLNKKKMIFEDRNKTFENVKL